MRLHWKRAAFILASLGWFQAAVRVQVTALGAPLTHLREQCPAEQSSRVDSPGKRGWFICCLFVLLDLEPASTSCLSSDVAVLSFEGFNCKALSGWCPSQGLLAPREGPWNPEAWSYCHRFPPRFCPLPFSLVLPCLWLTKGVGGWKQLFLRSASFEIFKFLIWVGQERT